MSQNKPILLMVTSQDWGGAQAYVFNLALELKKQGLPVIVCAGQPPEPIRQTLVDLPANNPTTDVCQNTRCKKHEKLGQEYCPSVPDNHPRQTILDRAPETSNEPAGFDPRRKIHPPQIINLELSQKCASAQIEFLGLKYMARDINPIANFLALIELIKLFRRLKPRTIQLNSSMMGAIGSLAGYLTKVPRIVYTAHGWVFNEQLPNWKKTLYIWIEKISARLKHVIICLHDQDLELAKKHCIKPRQKITVIPNGIEVTKFENHLAGREEACRTLSEIAALVGLPRNDNVSFDVGRGVPPFAKGGRTLGCLLHATCYMFCDERRRTLVGTVANAYPPKNLLWYLEVCQAVHAKDPDIRFVIAGDGPQMDELRAKHRALKQEEYVLLTGRLDPANIYRAFDIFVLPSSKEGMPITILEAMAAQLPIIATDVGACRLMLEPDAGLIVPPNDLSTLTQAILNLTADADKRQKLGQQAYQKVTQNFTWQNTADQTIKELL